MKTKILEKLRWKKRVNNTMAAVMHRFEIFMRTKMCGDAFKDIYSFYRSKKLSNTTLKLRSTRDALSQLVLRHEKLSRRYLERWRKVVSDEAQRKRRLQAIFANMQA